MEKGIGEAALSLPEGGPLAERDGERSQRCAVHKV